MSGITKITSKYFTSKLKTVYKKTVIQVSF